MVGLKMLVIFVLLGLATVAYSFAPTGNQPDQSVSVSYYDNLGALPAMLSDISAANPVWQDFQQRHGGNWWGQINSLTGQVHRAWGGSVYVGRPSDEASARDIALSFLRSEKRIANIDLANLSLISAQHHGHHWFVNFRQTLNELEIYGSMVTVRISDAGNVVLFGLDTYPGINISTMPTISKQTAISSAMTGVSLNNKDKTTEPELVVFPIPGEDHFKYHLAYKMEVTTEQPGHWLAVVDANSGELLYRKDMIYYYDASGFINGKMLPATPFDSLVTMPFIDERTILAVPETTYTDSTGFFNFDFANQQPYRLTVNLRGRFINVINNQGSSAQYIDTLSPGDTVNILWDTNARRDERNTYYQTHLEHTFFKALDPSFSSLDFPVTCNVNLNQTCNAYWDGSSINFFMAGGGCQNTGEIADVIYHEYGHGVTDYIYRPDAPSGAMHEGWSDYTAAMITNQPLIGRGFTGPGTYLRTVDNNNRWPEDTTGEVHNDGLIISGALWDLRQAMGSRFAYADSMFHFARYGLSHNFQDYLTDILIYDDDDDNIYNGTPHSDSIYATFDRHGIGPGNHIFITHTPLEDTQNINDPYIVTATITSTISPLVTDSIMVYYKLQHSGAFLQAGMHSTGNPNEFSASIDPQPIGTLVEYYISASNESGLNITSPETAPMPTYFFVVGTLTTQVADNLETDTGWQVGDPINDDARTGIWVRVDPVGTHRDNHPEVPYQPEDDHTPDPGIMCFITGQQPVGDTNNSRNDVDSGQTTVYSPLYDMSSYQNPVLELYRWFANSTNIDDTLYIDISSDGGTNWVNLEMVYGMQDSWIRSRYLLSQFINQFSQVKLRVIAEDRGRNSIVEAGIDDITISSLTLTGIGDNSPGKLPVEFSLKNNYPNPFNGRTEISFSLPAPGDVQLSIYDIAGRLVYSNLTPNMAAGNHSIIWDGHDMAGKDVSSGVYLYKIKSGGYSSAKKMLMLK